MKALLLIICSLPCMLLAQPTITADIVAEIGGSFGQLVAQEEVEPGPSGTNVTWDFRMVTPNDTIPPVELDYVDPANTPFSEEFPDANLASALIADTSVYSYFRLTNAIMEFLGTAVGDETFGFVLAYTNPETVLEFPFTYQSNFDDTYSGVSGFTGFETAFRGTVTTEGDGWGRLILPGGTFENVLRIKSVQERVDSSSFLGTVNKTVTTSTDYIWYSPDYVSGLASLSISSGYSISLFAGLPIGDTTFIDESTEFTYNQLLTNTYQAAETGEVGITLYPNPVRAGEIQINMTLEHPEMVLANIFNAQGRLVCSRKFQGVPGESRLRIPAKFGPGIYTMQLLGENRLISVQQFVKE